MNLVPVTSEDDVAELRRHPLIAVDLGFSTRRASCGFAWSTDRRGAENRNFGRAVDGTINLIREASEAVVIIEAPLSARFSAGGLPRSRFSLENAFAETPSQTRFWSQSPGVGMAFAALFFLRRLKHSLADANVHVHSSSRVLYPGMIRGITGRWQRH